MSHVRQQIREVVSGVLATALPNHTVFSARRYKINQDSLPMVDMKFLNENSDFTTMAERQDRTASLYIRVSRRATGEQIDDLLDDDAIAIEEAMATTDELDDLLIELALMQTNFTDSADGDKPIAELVLRYDMVYRTNTDDVETART